jgi:hypothetical protein
MDIKRAFERSKEVKPQTPNKAVQDMTERRTQHGLPVVRIQYSANFLRDPELSRVEVAGARSLHVRDRIVERTGDRRRGSRPAM